MYNILNITNLTDTPYQDIISKLDEAIEWVEGQENIKLTSEDRENLISEIDTMVEEFEENGKVSEALGFVDNLIVNFDHIEMVKEYLARKEEK